MIHTCIARRGGGDQSDAICWPGTNGARCRGAGMYIVQTGAGVRRACAYACAFFLFLPIVNSNQTKVKPSETHTHRHTNTVHIDIDICIDILVFCIYCRAEICTAIIFCSSCCCCCSIPTINVNLIKFSKKVHKPETKPKTRKNIQND